MSEQLDVGVWRCDCSRKKHKQVIRFVWMWNVHWFWLVSITATCVIMWMNDWRLLSKIEMCFWCWFVKLVHRLVEYFLRLKYRSRSMHLSCWWCLGSARLFDFENIFINFMYNKSEVNLTFLWHNYKMWLIKYHSGILLFITK